MILVYLLTVIKMKEINVMYNYYYYLQSIEKKKLMEHIKKKSHYKLTEIVNALGIE